VRGTWCTMAAINGNRSWRDFVSQGSRIDIAARMRERWR
jgi:hypothetical protein